MLLGRFIDAVENGWLILNSPFLIEEVKSFEGKLTGSGMSRIEHQQDKKTTGSRSKLWHTSPVTLGCDAAESEEALQPPKGKQPVIDTTPQPRDYDQLRRTLMTDTATITGYTPTKAGANAHGRIETLCILSQRTALSSSRSDRPTDARSGSCDAKPAPWREASSLSRRFSEQQLRKFSKMDKHEMVNRENFFGRLYPRARTTISKSATTQKEKGFPAK